MFGHGGGGGRCQNAQKHFIIKNLLETYFVKTCRQISMAYIRALVMSAYKENNCLISQPKHYVVGTQKQDANLNNGTPIFKIRILAQFVSHDFLK